MSILEEIQGVIDNDPDILMHYGMPRRSGRYPWGSGKNPYQRGIDFMGRIEELKKSGWKETPENIKAEFGLTMREYRWEKSISNSERRMYQVETAKSLKKHGYGATAIGEKMGLNESTVRSLLDSDSEGRMKQTMNTVDFLKDRMKEHRMLDVGPGVELELGIKRDKLDTALYYLKSREGYEIYKGGIPQATNPGQQTNQTVLCIPGTPHKDIYNYSEVGTVMDYTSKDGGETYDKFEYPKSMDSSRLQIRYAEDGGINKDGIIELRRGCKDLDLNGSHYAQVRILVDDNKYLKGMAVYSDDMPDGVDVIFNTNKTKDVPKMEVLKDIKNDPDNPFGSLITAKGQNHYIDENGKKQLSLINKRADEGDWGDWSNALPSQFLSKQSLSMAKKQLDLAEIDKRSEFEDICSLNNPTLKKHFLEKFASNCDSAAVDLKAAALPGQKYHVIIPVNSLKDNEIYAPYYADGTKLALIRYPHGGTFEIPICTVNNKQPDAVKLLGKDISDAVAINARVAERLSGADFDGDTVMCIPTHDKYGRVKVTSRDPLKGLEGFDPKTEYGRHEKTKDPDGTEHYFRNGKEYKIMKNTGTQMGKISNLITDMTLAGASDDELARAVRHSMVVIDAEKHKLDYKQSEKDNNIAQLVKEYQRHVNADGEVEYGGASTLISRAKGQYQVDRRQGTPHPNIKGKPWYDPSKPEGSLIYKTSDKLEYTVTKTNKRTGEEVQEVRKQHQKSTKMAETDDAMSLVSEYRYPMELLYAKYANSMKDLANQARIEQAKTGKVAYDKNAANLYKEEVKSLSDKLDNALLNASRNRAAERQANAIINEKKAAAKERGEKLKAKDIKKESQRALSAARTDVGSVSRKDRNISITDKEWEAIQKGAISESKLLKIFNNTDVDALRERAMPKQKTVLSSVKQAKINAMRSSNHTIAEIADALGVSKSTIENYLKGEK